jgi:hypothetical protein
MATQTSERYTTEGRPLALIFLITFGLLSLLLVGLLYEQVAQVLTRGGRCTVLSAQLTSADINSVGGETDGTVYYLGFQVLLHTADGQTTHVTGYYGSANYNFGDKASAQKAQKQYAVGSTQDCSYTYLDPTGTKAFFSPILPTEGIYFVSALLLASLVLTGISIFFMRKRLAPSLALPSNELTEDDIDFGAEVETQRVKS